MTRLMLLVSALAVACSAYDHVGSDGARRDETRDSGFEDERDGGESFDAGDAGDPRDGGDPRDAGDAGDSGDGGSLPSCGNEKLDEEESDVDCGGPCAPCPMDAWCRADADCESNHCDGGICKEPSCEPADACLRERYTCGSPSLVVCGMEQVVDCGSCSGGQACLGFSCRCDVSAWNSGTVTSAIVRDEAPDIAWGGGKAHAVAASGNRVLHATWSTAGSIGDEELVEMSPNAVPGAMSGAAIALFADGRPLVVAKEAGATVRQRMLTAQGWRGAGDVTSSDGRGVARAQVAIDSAGFRHFGFVTEAPERIEVSTMPSPDHSNHTVVDRAKSSDVSMPVDFDFALNRGGERRVAFARAMNGYEARVAEPNGSAFSLRYLLGGSRAPRITYDAGGRGYALVVDTAHASALVLLEEEPSEPGEWRAIPLGVEGVDPGEFDVAADANDRRHVVFAKGGMISYVHIAGASRTTGLLGPGKHPRVAVDPQGGVHVAYVTDTLRLGYAYRCP